MNREIKFRAWNGEYFHPLEDDGDYYFRDDGDGLRLNNKWGECKNTILLQFTGLKDKNGIEIYEGDILKFEDTTLFKWLVVFEHGCFGIRNIGVSGYLMNFYACDSEYFFNDRTLCGNQFEHPHYLINKKE